MRKKALTDKPPLRVGDFDCGVEGISTVDLLVIYTD